MDQPEQQATDTGTAGVIARPPFVFLGALLLGFGLDYLVPLAFPKIDPFHWIIAAR